MVSPFIDPAVAPAKSGTGPANAVGSAESAPAIRPSRTAQSSTVRASGPTVSSDWDNGIAPARLTRPTVVFKPVTPQKCAGMRIEPPVSDPSAAKVSRAATAAPDPDDDPPVMRSSAKGL